MGKTEIPENTRAHFECRVEPSRDPKMQISWWKDGKQLPFANRFHTTFGIFFLRVFSMQKNN